MWFGLPLVCGGGGGGSSGGSGDGIQRRTARLFRTFLFQQLLRVITSSSRQHFIRSSLARWCSWWCRCRSLDRVKILTLLLVVLVIVVVVVGVGVGVVPLMIGGGTGRRRGRPGQDIVWRAGMVQWQRGDHAIGARLGGRLVGRGKQRCTGRDDVLGGGRGQAGVDRFAARLLVVRRHSRGRGSSQQLGLEQSRETVRHDEGGGRGNQTDGSWWLEVQRAGHCSHGRSLEGEEAMIGKTRTAR